MAESESLIPAERIEHSILLIRGQKVILDRDLGDLYGVETKVLVRAVHRNADRFPDDEWPGWKRFEDAYQAGKMFCNDIDEEQRTVQLLAIGVKEGNRLTIGGEEVEL